MKRTLLIIVAIVIFWLLKANFVLAGSSGLLFSEVMYDPEGTDDKKEWLEISNPGLEMLTFPSIGQSKGKYIMPLRLCSKKDELKNICSTSYPVYFSQPLLEISPEESVVIAQDRISFLNLNPDYQGIVLESSFSLTNKADTNYIGLYETVNSIQEWKDQLVYVSTWGAAGNGNTLERIDLLQANDKLNWKESLSKGGSPGFLSQSQAAPVLENDFQVLINEVLPDPDGDDQAGEWIELYNPENQGVPLYGWSLKDSSGKQFVFNEEQISAKGYLVVSYQTSKIVLNNDTDEVFLYNAQGKLISQIKYGQTTSGWSWSRKSDATYAWTSQPTPNQVNQIIIPEATLSSTSGGNSTATANPTANPLNKIPLEALRFNELLPNPAGRDQDLEWIELANISQQAINLEGCKILNKAKKAYILPKQTISGQGLLQVALPGSFIRNSQEQLELFDPLGTSLDKLGFVESAKDGLVLARSNNGTWSWSRYQTPGKENRFNSLPEFKEQLPAAIFQGMPAEFKVNDIVDADQDKVKISWDFGDKKKSAAREVVHTYQKKGKYKVLLTINDGTQPVMKKFIVNVKEPEKPKLKITWVTPNPVGRDSGNEKIEIENQGKKKIELQGLKIANGRDGSNLIFHPINFSSIVDPGQRITINNSQCTFNLPNENALVAIANSKNQIIDQTSYQKEKIDEGDEYFYEDSKWQWFNASTKEIQDSVVADNTADDPVSNEIENQEQSSTAMIPANQENGSDGEQKADSIEAIDPIGEAIENETCVDSQWQALQSWRQNFQRWLQMT